MPAFAPIAITDGTDSHTFNPKLIDGNGVAAYHESSGVPVADRRITIARNTTPQGREKVTMKLVLPVVQDQTVNGINSPSIVRTAFVDVSFSFERTSTTVERTKARNFLISLLADPVVGPQVIDALQSVY